MGDIERRGGNAGDDSIHAVHLAEAGGNPAGTDEGEGPAHQHDLRGARGNQAHQAAGLGASLPPENRGDPRRGDAGAATVGKGGFFDFSYVAVQAMSTCLWNATPYVVSTFSFLFFVLLGNNLTTQLAFTSISL